MVIPFHKWERYVHLKRRGPLQLCLPCLLRNPCRNTVGYRVGGLKDRSRLKIHILELAALT